MQEFCHPGGVTPLFAPEGRHAAPEARRDRIRRMREAIQPLFLCAAKKKPLAVKRKRQRGISISPFGIPLKRPRRGCCPFLDHSRGLVCAKQISNQQKRDADAYQTDRRGSRNTLRLFRLPYVKYSMGANITKSICVSYDAETRF